MWMLFYWMLSHRCLIFLFFFMCFFSFCCSVWVSSIILSSSLLIHSSASSSLLLNRTSCVFFSSVIVFFSSVTSVGASYIFYLSVEFSRSSEFVSIFLILVLNSLSGRLLIFIPLKSFSEVLPCSFVWNILLCFFILPDPLFLFLCIRQISYISQSWRSGLVQKMNLFKLALALGCLSKLWDCLNHLTYSWYVSFVEIMLRHVSVPKGGISFSA